MKVAVIGGHFSPAYAVIMALKKDNEIVFIGRKHALEGDKAVSYEYQIIESLGIPFKTIRAARLTRKLTRYSIPSFIKFPKGFSDALKVLKSEKPDIVLSFGGYLSIPVCLAARALGIPIVVHEQTQEAGLANKYLAKLATRVCISYPSSEKYFPKSKTILTGNPVRPELFDSSKKIDIDSTRPLMYITGGSTGAHFINELISSTLELLLEKYAVIHQTGESSFHDFEKLEEQKKQLPEKFQRRYVVRKYIYPQEIGWVFKHADLIVARAGINTVNEIMTLNKRCLLIPLPHGQKNEQLKNAQMAKRDGYGTFLTQDEITHEKFLETVNDEITRKSVHMTDETNPAVHRIVNVLQLVYASKTETASD